MLRLIPLMFVAAACSAAPSSSAAWEQASPELLGQWKIVALDGRAPVAGHEGRAAELTFDGYGYGGYAGCNGFGGQGLAHEGRFYGGMAMSTAMACGAPFDGQETAVQRLLASAPRIEWRGADKVALIAPNQRMELERAGPLPGDRPIYQTIPLTGTSWSFGAIDGKSIEMPGARSGPVLTVEGDRFTLETPCLSAEGKWAQTATGAVTLEPDKKAPRDCNPASRGQSEAWLAAMQGKLRYGTGPNGEILLAGGGHWMVGDLIRRGSSEAASLAGRYEMPGGLVTAQRNGSRPELILTRNAYYLWDGCIHTEGLAIAFERQLFLHGSGVMTVGSCRTSREGSHFTSIVQSEPRIGRIPGGILLSSPAGDIRLRRTGDAPPGAGGVTTRLAPGMRFTLLGEDGGTLAILPGNRFRLTQKCGVTEGLWRSAPGEIDGALRFGPDRPAEGCERDAAARAVQNAFLGNVDVAIGPNRDIALFAGRFGAVRARMER